MCSDCTRLVQITMSNNQSLIKSLTLLALFCLVLGEHPIFFLTYDPNDFEYCLTANNITEDEYETFAAYDNIENLLDDKVNLKYKCNIHCQLQRQPDKWLNDQGRMDLKLMKATQEAGESITECMADAPQEQCAYSFKLIICAYHARHPADLYGTEFEYYAGLYAEEVELITKSE